MPTKKQFKQALIDQPKQETADFTQALQDSREEDLMHEKVVQLKLETEAVFHGKFFQTALKVAIEGILERTGFDPKEELRRGHDGVSQASYMVEKMIGECILMERPQV